MANEEFLGFDNVVPLQRAVGAVGNADPDLAGKALTQSRATGTPASVIDADFEGFQTSQRATEASRAVQSNPYISQYIAANDMHPKVSVDDYEGLQKISKNIQETTDLVTQDRKGLLQTIPEFASYMGTAQGRAQVWKGLQALPPHLLEAFIDPFKMWGEAASGQLDLTSPEQIDRAIGMGMMVAPGLGGIKTGKTATKISSPEELDAFLGRVRGMRTREEIDAFLREKAAGEGATPEEVKMITDQRAAETDAANLSKVIDSVQDNKTRTRAPSAFENFVAQHTDGEVGVNPSKILELYQAEDKVPAKGDGLFGYVDDLQRKLTTALETGGDVNIPYSQYVTYTDPTVHEKVADGVRHRADGVTLEEAKELSTDVVKEGEILPPDTTDLTQKPWTAAEGNPWGMSDADYAVWREQPENAEAVAQWERDNKIVNIKVKPSPAPEVDAEKALMGLDRPLFFLAPLPKGVEAPLPGMSKSDFALYSKRVEEAQKVAAEVALAKTTKLAKREQTAQWKKDLAEMRTEVEADLRSRPDLAADTYLRSGKLPTGEQAPIVKLNTADVARLGGEAIDPKFLSPDGVHPDELAGALGYESGAELIRDLDLLHSAREALKETPVAYLKRVTDQEVAQRMLEKYGNLSENIVEEAREAALSAIHVDLISQELRALAKEADARTLSAGDLKDWIANHFAQMPVKEAANVKNFQRAAGRQATLAERALLKKDYVEAFQTKQTQVNAVLMAKESDAFLKIVKRAKAQFDRIADNQVLDSVDQAHLDQAREILRRAGYPQKFGAVQPLEPLNQFIADSQGQIAMAASILDGTMPPIDKMNVTEFTALANSIKSILHVGRDFQTLSSTQAKAKIQDVIFDVKKELDRFNLIDQPLNPSVLQRAQSLGRQIVGAHLLVERMLDYTDRFDPHGPLTEFLDRPLRNSNIKELELTEKVSKQLRDLEKFTDNTINESIINDVIPDALAKSGFLNMRRENLRTLMLNMGTKSNIGKVTEGFGVREADVWKLINDNAAKADWQWVQGIWDIFNGLKPEADAMQLRDQGVPVDTIPPQAVTNSHGTWTGGYMPVVYDKARSNIQGHIQAKNPIFDEHYVQATTPQGYTRERTDFAAPLDLTGAFLPTRMRGMVHDIAFREAVRNANKLITNTEFMTAVAQKWGIEYADLLPGWIKDIANSHNFDDAYAQGITRALSIIRQNVISTLVAFNPGTFIKHGFTAAVMSVERVGAGNLASAAKELGVRAAAKTVKDLVIRDDHVPDPAFIEAFRDVLADGERGENVRQFILDSSAVMRNRSKQYTDSIRGAFDAASKSGLWSSMADFRQLAMTVGRTPVAFSDALSAMPTWYAAYKQTFLKGESHADAVFIADKEVSRAHGSGFVGDQARVTRLPNSFGGEILRWFVPLYRFWNHNVNNQFQLAWDSAAAMRGAKPGFEQEPNATARSIGGRLAMMMAIVLIEEAATAPLDEHKQGLGEKTAKALVRYLGAGFVGVREATNALASGYEPSVGLIGTVMRSASQTARDIAKSTSTKGKLSKDWLIHTFTALGMMTGVGGTSIGKPVSFGVDVLQGRDRPQNFNQVRQGLRTGHSKPRILP